MAVQKSRKTPSKRGMHRSHSALRHPRCRLTQERRNSFASSDFPRWILSRQEGVADQGGRGSGRRISRQPSRQPSRGQLRTVSAPLHIAIDAMSGDRGPSVSVPAALAAAREFSDVRFTLTGRQADLQRELAGSRRRPMSLALFASKWSR